MVKLLPSRLLSLEQSYFVEATSVPVSNSSTADKSEVANLNHNLVVNLNS